MMCAAEATRASSFKNRPQIGKRKMKQTTLNTMPRETAKMPLLRKVSGSVARAVKICEHGLHAEGNGHDDHGDDHARFAARAHFGDSIGPIGDDNAICDRVDGTHQKVADRARNAERKNFTEDMRHVECFAHVER